jgi:Ca2+:H+ antiporter
MNRLGRFQVSSPPHHILGIPPVGNMARSPFIPTLSWLLVCVPAAVVLSLYSPDSSTVLFVVAGLAIIPLAGVLGSATEHLAARVGPGAGGLLNATFGNAAELIIAMTALNAGLHDVVKASITGSIIGNLLLVLGGAFLAGGMKHRHQKFNATGARSQATTLTLAAIALIMPAMYHYVGGGDVAARESGLSLEISVVLIITYGLSLFFSLRTHKQLFSGEPRAEEDGESGASRSVASSLLVLGAATLLIAWMSEILVGSVEAAARHIGMSSLFVGVIILAVVGNAAEHSTAVTVARKNHMDLSVAIAVGSSIQVALFVAPVLVFASYLIGPHPLNLVFTTPEVFAIALAVLIIEQTTGDGESNWLEGVQLLSVYVILGMVFYFLPG